MSGDTSLPCRMARVFLSCDIPGKFLSVLCYVVEDLPTLKIPPFQPSPELRETLKRFNLNTPFPHLEGDLDMILGAAELWQVVRGVKAKLTPTLIVLDTIFGDVPCGADPANEPSNSWLLEHFEGDYPSLSKEYRARRVTEDVKKFYEIVNVAHTVEQVSKRFEKLWQIENFPRDESNSKLTLQ